MKKIYLLVLLFITPLFLSGCWLFEDDELADAEMNVAMDEVVSSAEATEDKDAPQESEEEEEEEEEELKVDEIFKGTWWLHMKYSDFQTVSEMNVSAGSFDSKNHYSGKLRTISSVLTDDQETITAGENDDLADYEIDGKKVRIYGTDIAMDGTLTLGENKSYVQGTFLSTLGEGTWYMTNQQNDKAPEF